MIWPKSASHGVPNINIRLCLIVLERINDIFGLSEVEQTFQRLSLARRNEDEERAAQKENRPFRPLSAGEQANYQRLSSQVLRCNVVQTLMGEDFRGFACRLAESPLLQWFCKNGPAGPGAHSGQERAAALQPVAAGSGHAEGDRHAAGGGE